MARCIVIGAGLAGLVAADALARDGVEVEVLEARDRVGGRVWSARTDGGGLIERGGEFITAGYAATEALADRLGLALDGMGIRYPDRALRPDPGIDRAAALAAAHAVERAAAADPAAPALALLEREVADPAIRELLASRAQSAASYPVEGLTGGHIGDIAHLLDDVETRRVRGGNQGLADGLADGLAEAVRLSTPVHAVRRVGGAVEVEAADGTHTADACVVAVPLPMLGRIAFEPDLPAETLQWIAAIPFGRAAKLALPLAEAVASEAIMSVPERFWAYVTPCDEVGGRVVGSWIGGEPVLDRLAVRDGPERWIAAVRELWPELPLDEGLRPRLTRWIDAEWTGGSYSVIGALPDGRDRHPVGDAVGPIAFAGEHTAPAPWTATIEGAIRSGARAADDVRLILGG
ncbi:MAG: flavin monoamine oxidase family protein [Gaiellales bacterium]